MHISDMQEKILKKFFLFEIKAFEFVVRKSAFSDGNTCHRESKCSQTLWTLQMWLRPTFYNSIYLEFMEKSENSGAGPILAVFRTR